MLQRTHSARDFMPMNAAKKVGLRGKGREVDEWRQSGQKPNIKRNERKNVQALFLRQKGA